VNFWLGTHQTEWAMKTATPLFLSAIRLRCRPVRARSSTAWALDSGGFTELNKSGRWTVGPEQYAAEVRRWRDDIGGLEWAAIQDWMCEPFVLQKTAAAEGIIKPAVPEMTPKLARTLDHVREAVGEEHEVTATPLPGPLPDLTPEQQAERIMTHQLRTVQSWCDLNGIAPELPWVPVLQGWEHDDYIRHYWMYQKYAGVDLASLPLVGLGSVCRRQNTDMAEGLIRELHGMGVRVHGFGFKVEGLRRCARYLASADSLAWSFAGRRVWNAEKRRLCGGTHRGGCANCRPWAEQWRGNVLASIRTGQRRSVQRGLFDEPTPAEPVASAPSRLAW
jgi:hypothetical protein